eukprot:scaffold55436_cov37-Phaeocystis_antarctica.AAC.3
MRWAKLEYMLPMPAAPTSTAPSGRCPTIASMKTRGAKPVTVATVSGHASWKSEHASTHTRTPNDGGAAATSAAASEPEGRARDPRPCWVPISSKDCRAEFGLKLAGWKEPTRTLHTLDDRIT